MDTNGNGQLTPVDALRVVNFIASPATGQVNARLDVNNDGEINTLDLALVLTAMELQNAFSFDVEGPLDTQDRLALNTDEVLRGAATEGSARQNGFEFEPMEPRVFFDSGVEGNKMGSDSGEGLEISQFSGPSGPSGGGPSGGGPSGPSGGGPSGPSGGGPSGPSGGGPSGGGPSGGGPSGGGPSGGGPSGGGPSGGGPSGGGPSGGGPSGGGPSGPSGGGPSGTHLGSISCADTVPKLNGQPGNYETSRSAPNAPAVESLSGVAFASAASIPWITANQQISGDSALTASQLDSTNGDDSGVFSVFVSSYRQYYTYKSIGGHNNFSSIITVPKTYTVTDTYETVTGQALTTNTSIGINLGLDELGTAIDLGHDEGQVFETKSGRVATNALTVSYDIPPCTVAKIWEKTLVTELSVIVGHFQDTWGTGDISTATGTVTDKFILPDTVSGSESNSVVQKVISNDDGSVVDYVMLQENSAPGWPWQ